MKLWIILLLFVFVGLIFINFYYGNKTVFELFENPTSYNTFNQEQSNFFNNEILSGIYVNPGLTDNDIDNLVDNAFKTTDLTQTQSTGVNVSDYMMEDPLGPFKNKDFLLTV